MAKILRKAAVLFGASAGVDEIAVFGSLAAAAPAFSTDPDDIQSLSQYTTGWFSAILGLSNPALEDMNALDFLFSYQIAYIMQSGIPEYNATTVYYINSMVSSGGKIYISLTDANTGNAVTDATKWRTQTSAIRTLTTTGTITALNEYVRLDTSGGSFTATLPAVAATPIGKEITVKNITSGANIGTLKGNASELIDLANTLTLQGTTLLESVTVINTGTKWEIK